MENATQTQKETQCPNCKTFYIGPTHGCWAPKAAWVHPFEAAGLGKAPFRFVRFEKAIYQACPDAPVQCGTSCDYCATGIMNVFWVRSIDGRDFKTGCDCIFKVYRQAPGKADPLLAEVKKAHRDMLKARRTELAVEKREALRQARITANASRAQAFIAANGLEFAVQLDHPIVKDMADRLHRWGDLSPKQVEFMLKLYSEAYGPQLPPEAKVNAPTGKVTVRGRVISTKVVEGMYGRVTKMTVKVQNGRDFWLCWGTVPASLYGQGDGGPTYSIDVKGCDVEFTATLTHGNEPSFAFFKRPTKATITANHNA